MWASNTSGKLLQFSFQIVCFSLIGFYLAISLNDGPFNKYRFKSWTNRQVRFFYDHYNNPVTGLCKYHIIPSFLQKEMDQGKSTYFIQDRVKR